MKGKVCRKAENREREALERRVEKRKEEKLRHSFKNAWQGQKDFAITASVWSGP